MKEGFDQFFAARDNFKLAVTAYQKRNDENKADKENVINMSEAIGYMNKAYDCMSEIWENDINV